MSLLERVAGINLVPNDETMPRISPHDFAAALWDLHVGGNGALNLNQIKNHFGLTVDERTSLDEIIDIYQLLPNAASQAEFLAYLEKLTGIARKSAIHNTEAAMLNRLNEFERLANL